MTTALTAAPPVADTTTDTDTGRVDPPPKEPTNPSRPVIVAAPLRHQDTDVAGLITLARALPETGRCPGTLWRRVASTEWLASFLADQPGGSWQDRWDASGLEAAGPGAIKTIVCAAHGQPATPARAYRATTGLAVLLGLHVIRPGFDYLLDQRLSRLCEQLLDWRADPDPQLLHAAPGTDQARSHATGALARLLVLTGRPTTKLTGADVLAYREAMLTRRTQSLGLEHLWACLQRRGRVTGTLRQALRPGQKTVTELVDNYPIRSTRIRQMFIAYLSQRAITIDYSTLRSVTSDLCGLFWTAIETIAPGIDTIDLPADVAAAWKEQLRHRRTRDGRQVPRRGAMNTLMTVRGFYADLLQLAYDDPARWAQWPCPAPVSVNEIKRYHKWRSQLRSEMHERTRTRTVKVTRLADAAETAYRAARDLYEAAHGTPAGGQVTIGGTCYVRVDAASHDLAHPRLRAVGPDGAPAGDKIDVVQREEDAFWGLGVVEVLRHTGIRIEEMLELTQLDVHEYQHRDPAVGMVLLLHVNPSKTDCERMLVVSPELAAILAAITRRVRHAVGATGPALPSVVLYDYAECRNSDPLPFFFQRTAGKGFKGTTRPVTRGYVQRVLRQVCEAAGLVGNDGQPITFTAHDFRRVFATDAQAAGLPPHIVQKLLGHASITTTQGYAAIFPDDVIRSHRAFIDNRRRLRPGEEYRSVTDTEWGQFEDHFATRKIAIGDCMRAYGTNCVHEYACEQCKLARPDGGAKPRLRRTHAGLLEQVQEARQRGWRGEIERLTYILAGVQDKLDEIERSERRSALVQLGIPTVTDHHRPAQALCRRS